MTPERFAELTDEILQRVRDILVSKNKEYARGQDKLHNFKRAGQLLGTYSVQALKGMLAKHTVSIYDMIDDHASGHLHPRALWLEKVVDHIAYLILELGLLEDCSGFSEETTQ